MTVDMAQLAKLKARIEEIQDAKRNNWALTARPEQIPPPDYSLWLVVSGRGWGKREAPPKRSVGWRRHRTSTSPLWHRSTSTSGTSASKATPA